LLFMQFSKYKRYVPINYWSIVVLMSIVGTLVTDILVDDVGISLEMLTIMFTIAMLLGFYIWHQSEHTLSIHSIDTPKREAYYWLIILLAFALGTGAGDLISEGISMGYSSALILFSGLISLIVIAFYVFKMNGILAFWLAFILTRPLGATLGDFLTKPAEEGGIGIDMLLVNITFFVAIAALVAYLSKQQSLVIGSNTNRRNLAQ